MTIRTLAPRRPASPCWRSPSALRARALAQEKVKIRIGTHISISAHLFMQKKPEILKNMGKTYDVEWVRFAGSGDAMPALVAGKLDACLATPFPMANAINQSRVPVTIVHQLLSFGFDGHYDDCDASSAPTAASTSWPTSRARSFGVNAIGGTRRHGRAHHGAQERPQSGDGPDRRRGAAAVPGRHGARQQDPGRDAVPAVLRGGAWPRATSRCSTQSSDIYGGPTDYVFMAFDDKFLKANQRAVRDYIEDYLRAVNWALDNRAEAVRIYAEEWKLPRAGRRQLPADEEGLPRAARRQASTRRTSSRSSTRSRPTASSPPSTCASTWTCRTCRSSVGGGAVPRHCATSRCATAKGPRR